jgi:hypothetical protein
MINFFFIEKMVLLLDGIIAPGIEWIASQHAPARHQRAFEGAVFVDRLVSVMRTGWIEPAGVLWQAARNGGLIQADQCQDEDSRPIAGRTR